MVAPNIRRVQTIRGQLTVRQFTNTTPSNIIVNPENSQQVLRVKSLVAANIHPTLTYNVSVAILRGGVLRHVIKTADVPPDSSLPIILEQISIYLEEGDSLQIYSNAADVINVTAMYEELSDITYTDIRDDAEPAAGVSVTVVPSTTSANEGTTITYNVTTTGIANGTTLYWTTNTGSGTINASDFSDGQLTGSFTITTGSGSFTRTLSNDLTLEGTESFSISVRQTSVSGTVLATSATVTINDTSTNTIQLIGSVTYSNVSNAPGVISYPTGGQTGDIAVLFVSSNSNDGTTLSDPPSGFTTILSGISGSGTSEQTPYLIAYRVLPSAPSGTVTISSDGTLVNTRAIAMMCILRNIDNANPLTVTPPAVVTATAGNFDPPAITFGSTSILFTMFALTNVQDTTWNAPTGFTTLGALSTTRGKGGSIGVAYQNNVAASTIDPVAFSNVSSSSICNSVAATIAFKRV